MSSTTICAEACALEYAGRYHEAEEVLRRGFAELPGDPLIAYHHALLLLARGEYEGAWPLFQLRLYTPFYQAKATTHLNAPYWSGETAPNARLLIHIDQGLGDLIMCARYIGMALERVGAVTLVVPEGSAALFSRLKWPLDVVELGQAAPHFDCHIHAFSLPAVFGTTLRTIPPAQCLRADPARVEEWRHWLGRERVNVGLCWKGNPKHPRDGERSIDLLGFEPLLRLPGIRFVSLQAGAGPEELRRVPADIAPADTVLSLDGLAALIEALDLVVSVDTAVAHLAGALGMPAWVALPFVADWRWLRHGSRSPWYETMRLFRQPAQHSWSACVDEMARVLASYRDVASLR